jgi:hypothetical protein
MDDKNSIQNTIETGVSALTLQCDNLAKLALTVTNDAGRDDKYDDRGKLVFLSMMTKLSKALIASILFHLALLLSFAATAAEWIIILAVLIGMQTSGSIMAADLEDNQRLHAYRPRRLDPSSCDA